jgi:hypothetical protein
MNTGQANQEKRTIKVRDFLDSFRSGMADEEILKKYHLSPVGLEKFYGMLLERGILLSNEMDEHNRQQSLRETEDQSADLEKSSFICPCCLSSHDTMFDICPNCGVSFQELMSRNSREEETLADKEASQPKKGPSRTKPFPIFDESMDEDFRDISGTEFLGATSPKSAKRENGYEGFSGREEQKKNNHRYDDALDEIIPGMPLEYAEDSPSHRPESKVRCDSCDEAMQPALRDVYDRGRSYLTLLLAGASLMLGILGVLVLGFFSTYSVARLLVLYATGLSLLSGVAFLTAGLFMYMARERVYFCSVCRRVLPRG